MRIEKEEAKQAVFDAVRQNMAIAELEPLGLSIRTIQGLEDKLGVIYLEELLQKSEIEIRACRNLGAQAVKEIEVALNTIHKLNVNGTKADFASKKIPNLHRATELRDFQFREDPIKRYDYAGRVIE